MPESTGHKLVYPYLAECLAKYFGVPGENLSDGDELNDVACRFLEQGHQIEDVYAALKTVASKAEALPLPEPCYGQPRSSLSGFSLLPHSIPRWLALWTPRDSAEVQGLRFSRILPQS